MECADLEGYQLIIDFGTFIIEAFKIPALVISGEIDLPDINVIFDTLIAMEFDWPAFELPSFDITADLDLDIDPDIALEVAIAFGDLILALFIELPLSLVLLLIEFDWPESLLDFIIEFLVPVMEYDAAIILAGCVLELIEAAIPG